MSAGGRLRLELPDGRRRRMAKKGISFPRVQRTGPVLEGLGPSTTPERDDVRTLAGRSTQSAISVVTVVVGTVGAGRPAMLTVTGRSGSPGKTSLQIRFSQTADRSCLWCVDVDASSG